MRKTVAVVTVVLLGVGLTGVREAWAQKDVRPAENSPISFRLASTAAARDCEKMTIGAETLYVASRAALSRDDVASAETVGGNTIEMRLADKAAERLAGLMKKHDMDRLAVVIAGKVVASGGLKVDVRGSRATLGGLQPADADRVIRVLRGEPVVPAGPTMAVVPSKSVVQPGEAIKVDVFVSGVPDLRVYQVGLAAIGGTRGRLTVEGLSIDGSRADYVFGARQKIDAVDEVGGRLGAMLFEGGLDVSRPGYLGTYTLRASADAAGSFSVNVQMDRTSFLRSSKNMAIEFYPGPAATITVETPARLQPTEGK
jgi:hypothetical protein